MTVKGHAIVGGRAVARTAGSATRAARDLPDFLIVGGQRCGTTSMFKTLAAHPAVVPPALHKGIHFFDMSYARGLGWYRGQFPLRATRALAARRAGAQSVTGESSPYYGFHPLAAQRIAADLPEVKVILLVRDPVERALSAHTHESARGYESETFEDALELEPKRTAGERERMLADPGYQSFSLQHHAYLERGQYIEQLERLRSSLGIERVLVVDSHRVFDGGDAMLEVYDFLGLEPPDNRTFGQHNARPRAPMDPPLRQRLEEHFQPYDLRLATALGWTPTWMT